MKRKILNLKKKEKEEKIKMKKRKNNYVGRCLRKKT